MADNHDSAQIDQCQSYMNVCRHVKSIFTCYGDDIRCATTDTHTHTGLSPFSIHEQIYHVYSHKATSRSSEFAVFNHPPSPSFMYCVYIAFIITLYVSV